jgi:hypothetical protein
MEMSHTATDEESNDSLLGSARSTRWNARSARVFGCGFKTVTCQTRPIQFFHSFRGKGRQVRGWVVARRERTPSRCAPPLRWGMFVEVSTGPDSRCKPAQGIAVNQNIGAGVCYWEIAFASNPMN